MTKQFLLLTSALSAFTLTASAALAADADDAAAGSSIGELVVTAEKREQNLQDVPVAISAFTSAKRDLIGINSVQDMTNFTPGMQYSAQVDRMTVRGIGRLSNVHAAEGGVSIYSDGIYTTSTVEAGKTPIFLDRVELLRGPQGTLYGRNAIAGAMNIISKRPTKDWYAEVRGTYSNYNRSLIEGAVSGPLSDNVQFRVAANWEHQTRGYFKNVGPANDEGNIINQIYVEGQLQFQFNDRFDGWVKVGVFKWDNNGGGPGSRANWTPAPYNTTEFGPAAVAPLAGYGYNSNVVPGSLVTNCPAVNPSIGNPRVFCADDHASDKLNDTVVVASNWNYHFDGMDLKYVTGGTHYHYTLVGDLDGTGVTSYALGCPAAFGGAVPCNAVGPLVIHPRTVSNYQEVEKWWSHEINLVSTGDGPVQWLLGGYIYNESYDQPVNVRAPDQAQYATPSNATCPFTNNVCAPNPTRAIVDDRPHLNIESKAVFGQIDWQATDTLKITGGLRYSHDHKAGFETVRLVCFGIATCYSGTPAEALGAIAPAIDFTQIAAAISAPTAAQGLAKGVTSFTTYDAATGFARRTYGDSWSAVTGTADVDWQPDQDTLVYARYSRGYKAGGYRIGIDTFFATAPETDAEHVNAYEIGLKKNFGHTLQTNVSLFYYDYTNAQVPISIIPTGGGITSAQSVFFNVPKSVSQGIELETTWQPIENLQILFNYSYLDAHIKEASGVVDPSDPAALDPAARPVGSIVGCTPATCATDIYTVGTPGGGFQRGQNLAGNRMPTSPKNKFALNANYTWRFDAGALTASASYIWRDVQYGTIFTRSYNRAPSWDQVDARLTWKSANGKYTIIGYGKNLFNELGYDGGATSVRRAGSIINPATLATTNVVQGISTTYPITPPRTYGVELQYRFF